MEALEAVCRDLEGGLRAKAGRLTPDDMVIAKVGRCGCMVFLQRTLRDKRTMRSGCSVWWRDRLASCFLDFTLLLGLQRTTLGA